MGTDAINETMTIPQILSEFPETRDIFKRYGLNPDGYKALEFENLAATSRVHQLNLQNLLRDLNQVIG